MNGFKYHSKQLLVEFYKPKVEKKDELPIANLKVRIFFSTKIKVSVGEYDHISKLFCFI